MNSTDKNLNQSSNSDNILPKDAAVLIIIDSSQKQPRMLMGLRNSNLAFMPGKFVFPGGGVDPCDSLIDTPDNLSQHDTQRIQKSHYGYPAFNNAKTLALTAIRETFEETGVLVGDRQERRISHSPAQWDAFLKQGVTPSPGALKFCARAITPADRVRRYDTCFFCVDAESIAKSIDFTPGELLEIHWLTFEETNDIALADITRKVLREIRYGIERGNLFSSRVPVPFFHTQNGVFRHDTIA